ncbi:MAG: MBL fold metallo-hydrolase [Thermoleophilia bacterium]|nr:MBL fold metallo-hydrolase [Thermoleophilia bacterium]
MLLRCIESPGYPHYSYVVADGSSGLVIDPRRDVDVYLDVAISEGFHITDILETHRHEDFVSGSRELAGRTGATVWRAPEDGVEGYASALSGGQEWVVGSRVLRAVRTPGHTPGSTSFLLEEGQGGPWVLFTGDTLFAGEVGRTDLFGPERAPDMARLLHASIMRELGPLPDDVVVLPAHGPGSVCGAAIADRPLTTLGLERRTNPKLSMDEADFVAAAAPDRLPPYLETMRDINTLGGEPVGSLRRPAALSPGDFARLIPQAQVVDARPTTSFATSHIPGALSLHPEGFFAFAGWFLSYERPVLLVCEPWQLDHTVTLLHRLGVDRVDAYLAGGMIAWHTAALPAEQTPTMTVHDACGSLDEDASSWLLDVRRPIELATQGEIRNAHNIPLHELEERLDEVPSDRHIYIFCGSGVRSGVAASVLARGRGLQSTVMLGGFAGWRSTSCPYELPHQE